MRRNSKFDRLKDSDGYADVKIVERYVGNALVIFESQLFGISNWFKRLNAAKRSKNEERF